MFTLKNLAIIPARGGSKRIPRKNIKDFCGKPIIAYTIETALKSELFDQVIVSTDDEEIKNIAESYGANVPFYRSKENSSDTATTVDVLLEVVEKLDHEVQNICCLYPTSPLLRTQTLNQSFKTFSSGDFDSLVPVCQFSYPPQRSLILKDNHLEFNFSEFEKTRSQDLEPWYHDAGQFYVFNVNLFLQNHRLWTNNTGCLVINELEAQDIDTEIDWKLAELKYKLLVDAKRNSF